MICCTFAGHREIFHAGIGDRISEIIEEILSAGNEFCFYSGGMGQFDALCERTVRQLRIRHADKSIRLILVEPYMKQSINADGERLTHLYDEIIIPDELSGVHYKSAITLRNRWMIDHSQQLIAYVHRNHGGAHAMLRYAEKKGLRVFSTL